MEYTLYCVWLWGHAINAYFRFTLRPSPTSMVRVKYRAAYALTDENEQWFLDTVDKHIGERQELFNTININEVGNVTYSIKPNTGRPMRRPIISSSFLPLVPHSDITCKKYLRLSADSCIWNGRDCVFKNLEFDNYIESMERNFISREHVY